MAAAQKHLALGDVPAAAQALTPHGRSTRLRRHRRDVIAPLGRSAQARHAGSGRCPTRAPARTHTRPTIPAAPAPGAASAATADRSTAAAKQSTPPPAAPERSSPAACRQHKPRLPLLRPPSPSPPPPPAARAGCRPYRRRRPPLPRHRTSDAAPHANATSGPERRENDAPSSPAAGSDQDDAAIRRLTSTYVCAIETKDLALFRSIKPNLSRDEERRLQDGFRAVTSQRVNVSVDVHRSSRRRGGCCPQTPGHDSGWRQTASAESQQTLRLNRAARAG